MITYKDLKKNTGKLAVGYASIGNRKDIDVNAERSETLPVGFFSIGNRPEVLIKKQISEWIYDKGPSVSEFERRPLKDFDFINDENSIPTGVKDQQNALNKTLEDHYHSIYEKPEKKRAFSRYCGSGSYYINSFLIARHLGEPYDKEGDHEYNGFGEHNVRQMIQDLDHHMSVYKKPAPQDFHVYTGVGSTLHIDKHRNSRSERLYLPAFTSTSTNPLIAQGFSMFSYQNPKKYNEVVRLHIPKGSEYGTHLGSTGLGGNGDTEHEHEFLMDRGHIIQFMGEPRIAAYGPNILVHDAKIIRQIKKPL